MGCLEREENILQGWLESRGIGSFLFMKLQRNIKSNDIKKNIAGRFLSKAQRVYQMNMNKNYIDVDIYLDET